MKLQFFAVFGILLWTCGLLPCGNEDGRWLYYLAKFSGSKGEKCKGRSKERVFSQ